MNYHIKQKLEHSKSKPKWFLKNFFLMFIMTLGLINMGCEKEDPIDTNSNVENYDEYYVKYVVNSKSIYTLTRTAQISSENNYSSFTFSSSPWEVTIGPVKEGFIASVSASYNTTQILAKTYINVEIQVSKNGSPFALKASSYSENVRYSASAIYTIN